MWMLTSHYQVRHGKVVFPVTPSCWLTLFLFFLAHPALVDIFLFFSWHTKPLVDIVLNTGEDIVDIKPANMEELTEVITAAEFHPKECNMFVYSSSKGSIRLCDMRERALCDKHAKCKFIAGCTHRSNHFFFVMLNHNI